MRIPREAPGTISITCLRASALRCSSAALAERKPSSLAISARVGGIPVSSILLLIRSNTSCWRGVNGFMSHLSFYTVDCEYIQCNENCKANCLFFV
ncbi:Uncharacterised protein [Vibrio cholerae]|nr:Uncharacterised protein [Vibrio cholerae]